MIVRTSDFQLDSYVPNKDDAPLSDLIGNEPELQGFIDVYEKEALVKTLGYDLYEEYIANFESDGSLIDGADEKWVNLTNGDKAYRGIKPMIIGYVFWKFIASDDSHYTTSHVAKENSDTATIFESRPKALENYNKFLEYAVGTYYNRPGIYDTPSIWGNLRVVMWSGSGSYGSNWISLYQYITTNIELYPDWSPENLRQQNYFDI